MLLITVLTSLLTLTTGAKILCIFPGTTRSHYTIGFTLMKEMADRGHDVTLVAPYKEEKPIKNLKSAVLTGFIEKVEEMTEEVNIFEMFFMPLPLMVVFMGSMTLEFADLTFRDEAIQNILHGNETYDVVILEHFFSESLQSIAYHLKAPSIYLSSNAPNLLTNHVTGCPDIYSYMPHLFLGYSQNMTFWQRTYNVLFSLFQKLYDHLYYFPKHNQIIQKYIPGAPDIYSLMYNTSLFIYNSDISYGHPSLLTPNMLEIGGFHVQQPKRLPQDLQEYLDEANDGVIYFSMGSNLKSKDLPQKIREEILRVFSKLKQKILWKFEEDLQDKPNNVEIKKWFPQRDILAHPNIKLFITHGGLLSTTESLHQGVPILGIPVYGDQALNMQNAVNNGYGIVLPYSEFTEEKFGQALEEILSNPSYTESVKRRSVLLNDKQVTQMDKAVYWIEYVIKHKGAPHLRSAALNLTWYQYYLLDVMLFFVLITVISFKIFSISIKKIFRREKKNKEKTN